MLEGTAHASLNSALREYADLCPDYAHSCITDIHDHPACAYPPDHPFNYRYYGPTMCSSLRTWYWEGHMVFACHIV